MSINQHPKSESINLFMQCNTSMSWCEKMEASRPFVDNCQSIFKVCDQHWKESLEIDLLEAFEGHPEIGNISTLREKYHNTEKLAGHEQSSVKTASDNTLQLLFQSNKDYKDKFGFIFIICASGKSADEMLVQLQKRLLNTRTQELINAAEEQRKITHIRLENLLK